MTGVNLKQNNKQTKPKTKKNTNRPPKKQVRNVCYPPIFKENELEDKPETLVYMVISY